MSYDRCSLHNLVNCIMCKPMARPAPPSSTIVVAPHSGWSPEDALDAMPGPATIQSKQPTQSVGDLDQTTKDAIARAEEIRRAAQGQGAAVEVNFGALPEMGDPTPMPVEAKRGIAEVIEGAANEMGKRGAEQLRAILEPAVQFERDQNPIVFAMKEYNAAQQWAEKAKQIRDEARRADAAAQADYEEAVKDRDLKKEILQKLVAGL